MIYLEYFQKFCKKDHFSLSKFLSVKNFSHFKKLFWSKNNKNWEGAIKREVNSPRSEKMLKFNNKDPDPGVFKIPGSG